MSEISTSVLQAEAYFADEYVLIRNKRTAEVVDLTKSKVDGPVREVPDFTSFLAETTTLIRGRRVLIALGDSRTANFTSWPRTLSRSHLHNSDVVVVNFADWSRPSEYHVRVLEFYLEWVRRCEVSDVFTVFVAGLTDIERKFDCYQWFLDGTRHLAISDIEDELTSHAHAAALKRLAEEVPTEWEDAHPWIVRRIIALTNLLNRLCREAGGGFIAALEPSSYADHSPAYERELRRVYEAEAAGTLDIRAWCKLRGYALDHGPSARPVLDRLRKAWQAEARRSPDNNYVDWSCLFRDQEECCFRQELFDATHYNELGASLIADAVSRLLPRELLASAEICREPTP
jgi:hypothetical protein